ncbi:hypothetical protein DFH06DRAFT_1152061 [Mycena polygramma]|nr:hypothetical protein DFH06DRAFT_1152061 [Mycena polygramma]
MHNYFPYDGSQRAEVYLITELFYSVKHTSICDAEVLTARALKHFDHFDDPDLKCKFYISLTHYHMEHQAMAQSSIFCQSCLSLAISTKNILRQSNAFYMFALIKWYTGNYPAAQRHAYESRRLALVSGHPYQEALTLMMEATCWNELGNHLQSITLCNRGRHVLALQGMSGGDLDLKLMGCQAEVHKLKSEYVEAVNIHTQILCQTSKSLVQYAITQLSIAEIEMAISPQDIVQNSINGAKMIVTTARHKRGLHWCDAIQGNLYLREGNLSAAMPLFQECLRNCWGTDTDIVFFCLENLGNIRGWGGSVSMATWTIVFLAHSLRAKQKLGIHKALQFLGDLFLSSGDEATASSLFTVALDGFTCMDVHRSRAECMLCLGDISNRQGNVLQAVGLWEAARPLFERSSQAKEVGMIAERLTGVSQVVLNKHAENLAKLSAPSEAMEDDLSEIEDPEDEREFNLSAVSYRRQV